jgi:hypothetical protein
MKLRKLTLVLGLAFIFLMASVPAVQGNTDSPIFSSLMGKPGIYVTITDPANGATVSGTVSITVDSNDNPSKVAIIIDGTTVAYGLTYSWDTTAYADGSHTIEASARGNTDIITVTVDNGGTPPEDYPPSVTITNPAGGSTVSGAVTIMVTVSDEDTLTPDIYIDGSYVATSSAYEWDTTAYADGSHTIYAEATDSIGQTGSDEISVTVDNTQDPPPQGNYPWWNDLIDAEVAHANGITGDGSVVVIIDTGLGSNYVDLFNPGSILTEYCWSQTLASGRDNKDWYQDDEGHGTACTATVLGYWLDLSDGTHEYVQGVAPDAKVVMIRTIYWMGGFPPHKAVTETEMLNAWADAIYYALDLHNGALSSYNMIISMSLGYENTNSYLEGAVDAAEADGVVLATSAGNDGHTTTTTGYPATYADTTSVAAAGWSSLTDTYGLEGLYTDIPEGDFSELVIADFSSGGKVDITGIGWNLILPQLDGYYYISGTSFSGPQVAGVYALMFQAHGTQSVAWLENTMQNSAYWNSGYMSSFVWGAGFVQADGACGL